MLLYALGILSIATFGFSTTAESKLPITTCKRDSDDYSICKQDSDDYSICLKNFLQEAWPQFVNEFDFPSLDPLLYENDIVLNSRILGKLIMSNFTAIGLSKIRFTDVRRYCLDNEFHLVIDTQVPSVSVKGTIKTNGGILGVTEDQLYATIENIGGKWDLKGGILNDTWVLNRFFKDVDALSFEKFKLLKGTSRFLHFIGVNINIQRTMINRMVSPLLVNTWEPWLIEFSNKILRKVPFSKLFP